MKLKEESISVCVRQPPFSLTNFVFLWKSLLFSFFYFPRKRRGRGVGGEAIDFLPLVASAPWAKFGEKADLGVLRVGFFLVSRGKLESLFGGVGPRGIFWF